MMLRIGNNPIGGAASGGLFVVSVLFGFACHDRDSNREELEDSGGRGDNDNELPQEKPPEEQACLPPVLFGHRGTILFRPDNTLPAFQWAIDQGGDGIEIDVRLTADHQIIAFHDAWNSIRYTRRP